MLLVVPDTVQSIILVDDNLTVLSDSHNAKVAVICCEIVLKFAKVG